MLNVLSVMLNVGEDTLMLSFLSVILNVGEDTLKLNFPSVILNVDEDTLKLNVPSVILNVGYRTAFVFLSNPLILGCTIWIRVRAMSPKPHFTFTIL